MKPQIILSLFLFSFLPFSLSLAQSYPTTCPIEAQGVLKAVGGCSSIDCKIYSNICTKCCVTVNVPVKTVTPTPLPTSTPTPKSVVVPAPKTTSQNDAVNPFDNEQSRANLRNWEAKASLDATVTPTETTTSAPKKEPNVGFIGFVMNIFSGFFKFFGLGK